MLLKKIKAFAGSILFLCYVSFTINIITFLFTFLKLRPSNSTLALHYNILVGVELFGKGLNIYFIPGIGLIITLINLLLYKFLKNNNNLFPPLAIFASIAAQLILLFSVLLLTQVN